MDRRKRLIATPYWFENICIIMRYKFKKLFIRLVTVSILFYVLWLILNKVSPTINPPKTSRESIERDYRGAIDVDIKQLYSK